MGLGRGLPPLEWVACETKGESTTIDTIMAVRTESRFHLRKLSEVLALVYRDKKLSERPVTW